MEPNIIEKLIKNALEEDLPWGDATSDSLIPKDVMIKMRIVCDEEGIISGLPVAKKVFRILDPDVRWTSEFQDGDRVLPGNELAIIEGQAQQLLKGERVALNFLQRMSGVATLTYRYLQAAQDTSDTIRVVDTRRTTPGMRYLEKYAVRVGGGYNHRYSLSDSVLIKNTHRNILVSEGVSMKKAVAMARGSVSHTLQVEIEIDSIDQIEEAVNANVDVIRLDGVSPQQLRTAVGMVNGRVRLEVSGDINLSNIADYAETGVDYISVSRLTHSAKALEIHPDYID